MEVTLNLLVEGYEVENPSWNARSAKNDPSAYKLILGDQWGKVEVLDGYPVLLGLAATILEHCPNEALDVAEDSTANARTGGSYIHDCMRLIRDLVGETEFQAICEELVQR